LALTTSLIFFIHIIYMHSPIQVLIEIQSDIFAAINLLEFIIS